MIFLAKNPFVDNYNLSSLNFIYCGAAPLSLDIQNEVVKRIGKNKLLKVFQGYGMTELSIVSTIPSQNTAEPVSSSVGKLVSGMSGKVSCVKNVLNY